MTTTYEAYLESRPEPECNGNLCIAQFRGEGDQRMIVAASAFKVEDGQAREEVNFTCVFPIDEEDEASTRVELLELSKKVDIAQLTIEPQEVSA